MMQQNGGILDHS